jgi:Fe-S-cluster containining protein
MEVSRERISVAATAMLRRTVEELGRACSAATCAALCRRTNERLDAELARARDEGAAVACAAGCAFCCHQRVSVLPHEAVALFGYLRTRLPTAEAAVIERRILENAAQVDRLTVAQHHAANLRCAFLRDGRCSVYQVRPSICASFHSMSRERCEYSFDHPQDIGTPRNHRPVLLEVQALAEALVAATRAGLAEAKLDDAKLELNQALRVLLADPRVVERWCGGGPLAAATNA